MPRTIIIDQSHTRSQPTARLATRASSYGLASRGGRSVPRGLGHVTISTPIAQQDQLDTLLQALVTVLGSDGAQLYEDSEGYHIDAATYEALQDLQCLISIRAAAARTTGQAAQVNETGTENESE